MPQAKYIHYPRVAEKSGYIYVGETPDGQYVKIGFSVKPFVRLKQIAGEKQSPFPRTKLKILGLVPAVMRDEWTLHLHLLPHRLDGYGEWYRKTDEVQKAIDGLNLKLELSAIPIQQVKYPTGGTRKWRLLSQFETLSPREEQLATRLCSGMRAIASAKHLGISPKSVDTYRASLMSQLDEEIGNPFNR